MRNVSVLITGANGQLGRELAVQTVKWPQFTTTFVGREQLDFSRPENIFAFFANRSFDIVINCAAYTAVDKAEDETELADAVNHRAVAALAQVVRASGGQLIHISTDYVFDGCQHRPYVESDSTAPQTVYGLSKHKGEEAFIAAGAKGIIIRTSWVYSQYGNNFVKTMLRLGAERDQLNVVFDQIGSPTHAQDLAAAIFHICAHPQLDNLHGEIFHFSNEGVASWYDFAAAIFSKAVIGCKLLPIESSDYPTPARRPHYSVLNKQKIKNTFGLDIQHWQSALNGYPLCISPAFAGDSAEPI